MNRFNLIWLVICGITLSSPKTLAQTEQDQITAALIYKISMYTEFKDNKLSKTFCFVGSDSFHIADAMEESIVRDNKTDIKVRTWANYSNIQKSDCQVIFSSPAIRIHRKEVSRLSETALTIGNNSELSQNGNIMSITVYEGKPLISFSKSHLKASNITVQSNLLRYLKKLD
jgi:hypothetical protein